MKFEYIVIPAPTRMKRNKNLKTAVERLAFAMGDTINEMAADGWNYMRTETLTVEDKPGRFKKVVERIETILVFRRELDANATRHAAATHAEPIPAPNAAPAAQALRREPVAAGVEMRHEPRRDATPAPKRQERVEPKMMTRETEEPEGPSLGGASRDR